MNQTSVLLVDDDRQLLDGVGRNLSLDYELVVADSGQRALELLDNRGAFPVVVTDMRMPGMDGVEFIEHARRVLPDTSFIMLTGNQDLDTAIRAVNEGQVFRFLNKPCDVTSIKSAIEAGRRQYDLSQAEKVLLNKTCAGAVGMLMDVLEMNQPEVGQRLASLRETFEALSQALGIAPRWELALASRLALIGLVCFEPAEAKAFFSLPPNDAAWKGQLGRVVNAGARVIKRIPRLGAVARLLQAMPDADGSRFHDELDDPEHLVEVGATMLHVSALWDAARSQGLNAAQAIAEVRQALHSPRPEYLSALERLPETTVSLEPTEVAPSDLRAGMVLHEDVTASDGSILVRAGKRLTDVVIERIRERYEARFDVSPIIVVDAGVE